MEDVAQRLAAIESKLDALYTSHERSRRFTLLMGCITILMIVGPLLLLPLFLPSFLATQGAGVLGL